MNDVRLVTRKSEKNKVGLRYNMWLPCNGKYHLKFSFWLFEPLPNKLRRFTCGSALTRRSSLGTRTQSKRISRITKNCWRRRAADFTRSGSFLVAQQTEGTKSLLISCPSALSTASSSRFETYRNHIMPKDMDCFFMEIILFCATLALLRRFSIILFWL